MNYKNRIMRKLGIVSLLLVFGALAVSAQSWKGGWRKYPNDWHLRSYEKDTMYGSAIYEAYEYLKGRQPKREVVVAVIDGGLDTSHEDLKARLWTNAGEIPGNGVDDDGNGYVDDVHGWNFLGKADGSTIANISTEADRYFAYLYERFKDADTTRLSEEDLRLYRYYRTELPQFSAYAAEYKVYAEMVGHARCAEEFDKALKAAFPGEQPPALWRAGRRTPAFDSNPPHRGCLRGKQDHPPAQEVPEAALPVPVPPAPWLPAAPSACARGRRRPSPPPA